MLNRFFNFVAQVPWGASKIQKLTSDDHTSIPIFILREITLCSMLRLLQMQSATYSPADLKNTLYGHVLTGQSKEVDMTSATYISHKEKL